MANVNPTIYEELAPFAAMVVDQSRGVTVGDLMFASAQDFWSTCVIPINAATAGQIDANSEAQLFYANVGQTGQGFTTALTISQTNNKNGDRMPANQVYIGLKLGFEAYRLNSVSDLSNVQLFTRSDDLYAVMSNFVWSLNVGDGIKRDISALVDYPGGSGIYSASSQPNPPVAAGAFRALEYGVQSGGPLRDMKALPLPVIFPPNIAVDIRVKCGNSFTLNDTTFWTTSDGVAIKAKFRGYMMTLPA